LRCAAAGAPRDRGLPHRGPRRRASPMRRLRRAALPLSLLWQPALPQVPAAGEGALARRSARGAPAGALLPPRLHAAAPAERARARQPPRALRDALCRGRPDTARVRSQPALARGRDRRNAGATHLGTDPHPAPARARAGERRGTLRRGLDPGDAGSCSQ
jgi:hypothetical protein